MLIDSKIIMGFLQVTNLIEEKVQAWITRKSAQRKLT